MDSLMLIGLLPDGGLKKDSMSILESKSSADNYEEWAKYVANRVERDARPKVVVPTVDKFIKLNLQVTEKKALMRFMFDTSKSKKEMKLEIDLFLNDLYKYH